MRYKISRIMLLSISFFIGIDAFVGGISDLMEKLVFLDTLLPYFQILPFADILFQYYIFSGIMLIIINGITNIICVHQRFPH